MARKIKSKLVIGRADKLDLVDMGLYGIHCKIDTGAETSSIHCNQIHLTTDDGKECVKFCLLDSDQEFVSHDFSEKLITNSFGHSESRYVIETNVVLFGKVFPIQFTLSDRQKMKYPILLGRRFLQKNKLIVDVSKKNVSSKKQQKISPENSCSIDQLGVVLNDPTSGSNNS